MTEATETPRRRFRLTPFRRGLLAGSATFIAMMTLGVAALDWFERGAGHDMDHNVEVAASGEALTRHGARQLELRLREGRLFRQVCNEACDDLSFKGFNDGGQTYGAPYVLAVLDASGRCLSCDNRVLVDDTTTEIARLEVRDEGGLPVRGGYFARQPDGSLKLVRAAPPPAN